MFILIGNWLGEFCKFLKTAWYFKARLITTHVSPTDCKFYMQDVFESLSGITSYNSLLLEVLINVHGNFRAPTHPLNLNMCKVTIAKQLCHSLFFNNLSELSPANYIKKRFWYMYIPMNLVQFLSCNVLFLSPVPLFSMPRVTRQWRLYSVLL